MRVKGSPEDIDIRGESGEESGQRAGGEVEPGGGEGREPLWEGDEEDGGGPGGEGDGEDEGGDLGGAEFLFGVEEVIHGGGAAADGDGEAPSRLRRACEQTMGVERACVVYSMNTGLHSTVLKTRSKVAC